MATLFLYGATLFVGFGAYQWGFTKGYEAQKADHSKFQKFWKEVARKGLK